MDAKAPITAHLLALRKTLIASAGAVLVAFVAVFSFLNEPLMDFITLPIRERGVDIIYTAVSEAMVTQLKVCLIASIVIASPFVCWQVWLFVRPALYPRERRLFRWLFGASVLLFVLGVAFCYVVVYTMAIDFFLVAGENMATPMISIDKYVDFLFGFVIPFGLVFLLPVALFITTRMGLTSYETMKSKRKYVILAVSIIAAILTPPDVVSQICLLIPMVLLFEAGLQVSRLTRKRERE
ncbi:MAG TPA: twin-arginine translocase subunit TatC [Candidatus Limiplasma stercoravium]|nr:twin-arginine translocase subunit TatC [Candidatus Limiplasma stercoravium]